MLLSALVNSKRGVLAKVSTAEDKNQINMNGNKRNKVTRKNNNYQPYFKDWKLDEEIRLLQQL